MSVTDRAQDPYAARPWTKSYPPESPADIDCDKLASLVDVFKKATRDYAQRPAFESFGAVLTYAELDTAAQAVASWLQAQGVEKGDRIAIMAPNVMAYPAVIFGILMAGGVVVNVNPLYTPHELQHQISDSGAKMVFVLENFAHTVAAVWPELALDHAIIVSPGDLLRFRGVVVNAVSRYVKCAVPKFRIPESTPFSQVLAEGRKRPLQPTSVSRDDVAFLQYTGGTTGVAKGAVLLHRNLTANVAQAASWLDGILGAGPHVMVAALPFYHIFGLTCCCVLVLSIGAKGLLIANPRDIAGFTRILRGSPFTMFSGVNTLYAALMENADFRALDFSRMGFCISGGMATQDVVAKRWKQLTGRTIIEGYGLSETSPIVTINRPDLAEFSGAIGYPVASTEISIRNDDGAPAPQGERGELWVRGPQVMQGYWNRPDETATAMDADGFFHTGDVAVMAPDGLVKIVDRLKDMILVSGFNVYPNEVENVLTQHPKVKEAAVIGVPSEHSGEAPVAFVVRRDPSLTAEELRAFAHETLTSYKVPRIYEFRDELPKTNVGKILRRVLREEYLAREKV